MLNRAELCAIEKYPCLINAAAKSGFEVTKIVGVMDSFVKAGKGCQV
jgi:hypothetical protein